jgi:hypothetical protein
VSLQAPYRVAYRSARKLFAGIKSTLVLIILLCITRDPLARIRRQGSEFSVVRTRSASGSFSTSRCRPDRVHQWRVVFQLEFPPYHTEGKFIGTDLKAKGRK